ncbi:MAG TPA: tetratricopeptide repeat protein [Longimicrobium sp.]|nr:tetratricopeptide repeat protein [Longimicrobium sp.]
MPGIQRRELDVLREASGGLGFALWRVLCDVILWCGVAPEQRATAFHGGVSRPDYPVVADPRFTSESGTALQLLGTVATKPEVVRAGDIADACATIRDWAEGLGLREIALQFAEASARAVSDSSHRSYEAGGLCRRAGEFERGAIWFQRAVRLARSSGDNVAYANAQRGFGSLLLELGRFREAEPRLHRSAWAARKAGRRRLAGAAYHDLLVVTVHEQRWAKALDYAHRAVTLYGALDPRLPRLAHDVAYMWCRHGFFSSALPIFECLPPLFEKEAIRVLLFANFARAAAAVRDRIRFEQIAGTVLNLVATDTEWAAPALYHIAEGTRSFEQWERAAALAEQAVHAAQDRKNTTIVRDATELLAAVSLRQAGDVDVLPDEGHPVHAARRTILRKLRRQIRAHQF